MVGRVKGGRLCPNHRKLDSDRTSQCWMAECMSVLGGWHFRLPQSSGSGLWVLRFLDPCPSWVMGLAQLGPDYLQSLRCSKEAEPLLRPPSESEFVVMSGLINGVGRGNSCSVT